MFRDTFLQIYYINLDKATDRRSLMEQQAQRLGLTFNRVSATSAEQLDEELLSHYDVNMRRKEYSYDLLPTEHACIQSHLKTLRMFMETKAQFAIILEDDCRLEDNFVEGIEYLLTKTTGWLILRLQSPLEKYYTIWGAKSGAPCEIVLPCKPMCASTAILYTREGAKIMLKSFEHYCCAFDTHMGRSALLNSIPFGATLPNLVSLSEASECTMIGNRSNMKRRNRNSFSQYIYHRFMVMRLSVMKLIMPFKLRKVLRILD